MDPEGYSGIGVQTFSVLTNPCVIDNTAKTMSLLIADTETLYLTMRATDNKVIADATVGGAECAVPSTYKIDVTETGATGTEKVFLDYINGPFALGSSAGAVVTPGLTLTLGAGSTLLVRGSSSADKFNIGSTFSGASVQYNWLNVNGDTSPDVRMAGVTDVVITSGPGNDTISADGANGTSALPLDSTIAFTAWGGTGDDTLTGGASIIGNESQLHGEDGDDKFVQTATLGADMIDGGKGFDTVDYSVRTAAVNVTICAVGSCVANDDGDIAAVEGDDVNEEVEIVLGGKGDDTLDASAPSAACSNEASPATVKCTLKGQDGNDTLTGSQFGDLLDGGNGDDTLIGGLGNDTFVGGAGVDTVSYADRAGVVKVSLDPTKLWQAFQNGAAGELDSIGSDVENLTGGDGADFLRGNASANIIHGGIGADTIEGGAGNDTLYGDVGADKLYGGAGNDVLIGGNAADTLVGGDGDDFIDSVESTGAAAADTDIECDGVNDFAGTAGTAPGTNDALISEGADSGVVVSTATNKCEH